MLVLEPHGTLLNLYWLEFGILHAELLESELTELEIELKLKLSLYKVAKQTLITSCNKKLIDSRIKLLT